MNGSAYFLSDLHLDSDSGERLQRLLSLLDEMSEDAKQIYFVGDVFDFWLGYSSVIFKAYYPFLRKLDDLVRSGIEVFLFSGNHDPDPGHFFTNIGVKVHETATGIKLGDHRVWLDHGDLVDPRSRLSRLLCRFARAPLLRRLARTLHPDLAWQLSRLYAHKREGYTDPLPSALLEQYFPERITQGYDTIIIGHYHRAVRHERVVNGKAAQLFALGDWVEQRTYLQYDGNEFILWRDNGSKAARCPLALGDYGPGEGHSVSSAAPGK